MLDRRIPAFCNPRAGTGKKAIEALERLDAFEVHAVEPDTLDTALREAMSNGATRVAVAGGDGTVATAAAAVVGTSIDLAVIPGGTFNHFAKAHRIPTDVDEAAHMAEKCPATSVDVAYVNDRLFLNTSSVGAYALYVRTRDRLERRLGYGLASVIAGLRLLGRVRPFSVTLEVEGQARRYRSSLVFVGVGERELQVPVLGAPTEGGRRGLHVMVVRGGTGARLIAVGLAALVRGVRSLSRTEMLDSFIVDRCQIDLVRPMGAVATDGELTMMNTPLEYRLERGAVRLVAPR